jgi:hypothetical protein
MMRVLLSLSEKPARRGVSRAESGHNHTMRAEFVMQGIPKGEYICLGRRIGRVAGNGLEGHEAGDEKYMSRSPLGHIAAEEIGQLCERRDVELDHVRGAVDRRFQQVAVQAVSGIVQQDVDGHRPRVETAFQAAGRAGEARSITSTSTSTPYLRRRSEASFSIDSCRRAANTRLTFCAASRSANSRPRPLDAPVIRAHFPAKLFIGSFDIVLFVNSNLMARATGEESSLSNHHRLLGEDTRHRALR